MQSLTSLVDTTPTEGVAALLYRFWLFTHSDWFTLPTDLCNIIFHYYVISGELLRRYQQVMRRHSTFIPPCAVTLFFATVPLATQLGLASGACCLSREKVETETLLFIPDAPFYVERQFRKTRRRRFELRYAVGKITIFQCDEPEPDADQVTIDFVGA